ncbi:MAG TPA: signal peptidase II [Solirubrobacteraceae bacterium]|jgi:signal peptidase II|nr:signal peptidase II [Solirubrobacteraceae bacterium]
MAVATRTDRSSASRLGYVRAAAVLAVVLIVDQVTKHAVESGIAVGQVEKVIPGIKLVHVRNTGVAFSLFSGGGTIVLVITLVALAGLVVYFARRPSRPWLWLPTGLLVGGAIGNLIDRVRQGAVTDFIKLPHWPAFNVADSAITLGVIALLITIEVGSRRSARAAGDG